jgi:hypothetical protein
VIVGGCHFKTLRFEVSRDCILVRPVRIRVVTRDSIPDHEKVNEGIRGASGETLDWAVRTRYLPFTLLVGVHAWPLI